MANVFLWTPHSSLDLETPSHSINLMGITEWDTSCRSFYYYWVLLMWTYFASIDKSNWKGYSSMWQIQYWSIYTVSYSGIFAYLNYLEPKSQKEILECLVRGLKRLEYRGYDSAGLAFCGGQGNSQVGIKLIWLYFTLVNTEMPMIILLSSLTHPVLLTHYVQI